jgi:flavin-dependent dehydrogenase
VSGIAGEPRCPRAVGRSERPRVYDRPIERFEAIVVGAGPAGSLCAHRLACGGASVLLLDRASFPRDKPCGGGVTIRAARLLPFALDSVVEDRVERVELRFG